MNPTIPLRMDLSFGQKGYEKRILSGRLSLKRERESEDIREASGLVWPVAFALNGGQQFYQLH